MAGPAVYLLGHVAFELRLTRTVPRQRLVAAFAVLAITPLGTVLPALATWTIVYGLLAAVAALETYARLWGRPEGVGRPGWPAPQDPADGARARRPSRAADCGAERRGARGHR